MRASCWCDRMKVLVQGVICKPCALITATCLNRLSRTIDGSIKGLGAQVDFWVVEFWCARVW